MHLQGADGSPRNAAWRGHLNRCHTAAGVVDEHRSQKNRAIGIWILLSESGGGVEEVADLRKDGYGIWK